MGGGGRTGKAGKGARRARTLSRRWLLYTGVSLPVCLVSSGASFCAPPHPPTLSPCLFTPCPILSLSEAAALWRRQRHLLRYRKRPGDCFQKLQSLILDFYFISEAAVLQNGPLFYCHNAVPQILTPTSLPKQQSLILKPCFISKAAVLQN